MIQVAATTTPLIDVLGDSLDESDGDDIDPSTLHVGSMASVPRLINGIPARSDDDGREGLGRHGASIRRGRSLWQSADLPDNVKQMIA